MRRRGETYLLVWLVPRGREAGGGGGGMSVVDAGKAGARARARARARASRSRRCAAPMTRRRARFKPRHWGLFSAAERARTTAPGRQGARRGRGRVARSGARPSRLVVVFGCEQG